MNPVKTLIQQLQHGDKKALARCITIVENNLPGNQEILTSLKFHKNIPVIGVTGPPGAGKSTLINAIIKTLTEQGKSIGIIAIDPTSPFNYGSILGDRLRMAEHFTNENVFIRSLATRGALGGLSATIIEVVDIMRAFGTSPQSHSSYLPPTPPSSKKNGNENNFSDNGVKCFDYIIIETVGVGQSEVEIVGLADTTILVLVPESGDEIQTLKSGVMEIADVFVVNKSDRSGAEIFMKNIIQLVHSKPMNNWNIPVIKAIATKHEGIDELIDAINRHQLVGVNTKRPFLLAEKAYRLIQNHRMKDVSKKTLQDQIETELKKSDFNLYRFVRSIIVE